MGQQLQHSIFSSITPLPEGQVQIFYGGGGSMSYSAHAAVVLRIVTLIASVFLVINRPILEGQVVCSTVCTQQGYTAVTNHLVRELGFVPQGISFLLPFNPLPSILRCGNFYYIPFYSSPRFTFFQWTPFGDLSHLSVNFYPSGFTQLNQTNNKFIAKRKPLT